VVGEEGEAGRVPLGPAGAEPLVDGGAIVVGVRPEHLRIDGGHLRASVSAIEWLGHERHVICDLAGSTVVVRQPASAGPIAVGDAVALGADPADVHLFDPATTERLN
jgi:multiple sugar transport system ATP-binding protein